MNMQLIVGAIALAVATLAGPAHAADSQPSSGIFARTWADRAGDPLNHLRNAHAEIAKKRPERAAQELRRAASGLDVLAARLVTDEAATLRHDSAVLVQAAQDIHSGVVTTAPELDRRLADVHADLAKHHLLSSDRDWQQEDYVAAGAALATAARHVEAGLKAVGERVGEDLKSAADYGRRVAHKDGVAISSDFDRARAAVGKSLDSLGHAIGRA